MIKKYSEEKRMEVINARKDGTTIAQITTQTGVGQTTVKAWLKDAGLTANRKWESDEIQTILQEYENAVPQRLFRKNTESVKAHFTVCIKKYKPSSV